MTKLRNGLITTGCIVLLTSPLVPIVIILWATLSADVATFGRHQ